jgi:hypothetical protein
MYVRVFERTGGTIRAFFATCQNGDVTVTPAHDLPDFHGSINFALRSPDGSLWITNTPAGESSSVQAAYNAGGISAAMLSTNTLTQQLTPDGTLKHQIRGAVPLFLDHRGDLWLRLADTRDGPFQIYHDEKLFTVDPALNLSPDTDFIHTGDGRLYVFTEMGLRQLIPNAQDPGAIKPGRLFMPEIPVRTPRFSAPLGLLYATWPPPNTYSVMPQPGEQQDLSIFILPK